MSQIQPLDQLRIEDERRLILGTLMTHGPETVLLRERALDQLVLAALFGSSETRAFKNGDIQKHLREGLTEINIRPETINQTLDRLLATGQVQSYEERKKKVYFTTQSGNEILQKRGEEAESLLEPVLDEILLTQTTA
jgi:hypothetical protein